MIRLNQLQLERLSEILGNLSLLFFASLILPIIQAGNSIDLLKVFSGTAYTLLSFFISIFILRKGEA